MKKVIPALRALLAMALVMVTAEILFRRLLVPALGVTLTNTPDFTQWPGMLYVGLLLPLAMVALSLVLFRFVDRHPLSDFGLGMDKKAMLVGWGGFAVMLAGFALFILITQLTGTARWKLASSLTWRYVLTVAAVYIGTGVWEEFFFRGYLYRTLTDYGRPAAYVISILFFTFIHFTEESLVPSRLIGLLLTSFLYTYAFDRTRSIWPGVIFHGGWDLVNFLVIGNQRRISLFIVSGDVYIPDLIYSIVLDAVLIVLVWMVSRTKGGDRLPEDAGKERALRG